MAARCGLAVELEGLMLMLAAALALWITLDRPLPAAALSAAEAAVGLGVGLGSTLDGLAPGAQWVALAGTLFGSMVLLALPALVADEAHKAWQRIALRVAGSWLAAAALLVLALMAFQPSSRPVGVAAAGAAVASRKRCPPAAPAVCRGRATGTEQSTGLGSLRMTSSRAV